MTYGYKYSAGYRLDSDNKCENHSPITKINPGAIGNFVSLVVGSIIVIGSSIIYVVVEYALWGALGLMSLLLFINGITFVGVFLAYHIGLGFGSISVHDICLENANHETSGPMSI